MSTDFFDRSPQQVARELIGKILIRKVGEKMLRSMITETEAYAGAQDLASHARFGHTARTAPMFMAPGTIYIYFTYGMHWMLNITCETEGKASAVLIRGTDLVTGPARLTKALQIDKKLNGKPIGKKTGLWIEDRGIVISKKDIRATPRIGIEYAGPIWKEKKCRFIYVPQAPHPNKKPLQK